MTQETKPKLDVAGMVARAKEKTEFIKNSAEKISDKIRDFKIIPGFSKYEFNGNIIRNVKTKHPISPKTGRTKYQIFNDEGVSHNLNKDEIKALFPVEAISPAKKKEKAPKEPKQAKLPKEAKAPKEKKEKTEQKAVLIPEEFNDLSTKEILALEKKNNFKHFLLSVAGKTSDQIHELTGSPIPSIKRDIWRFKVGKTVF